MGPNKPNKIISYHISLSQIIRLPHPSQNPKNSLHFTRLSKKNPATFHNHLDDLGAAQRSSWGENLTYYTGIGYLVGATGGGAKGFVSAVKTIETTDTLKLKINRILNGSGHTGRQIDNRCGVIGWLYAGLESGMVAVRDTDDVINNGEIRAMLWYQGESDAPSQHDADCYKQNMEAIIHNVRTDLNLPYLLIIQDFNLYSSSGFIPGCTCIWRCDVKFREKIKEIQKEIDIPDVCVDATGLHLFVVCGLLVFGLIL